MPKKSSSVLEIPSSVLDPFLDGLDGTIRKKKTIATMFQLYLSKHIICDPESNEPIRITPVEKFPTREDDEELCKRFMEWLPTQYPNLRHVQPVARMGPIAADAPVPITANAPPSVPEAVPDETEERLKREIEAGLKRARLAELEAKLAEARLREDLANAAKAAAETKRKEEIEAAEAKRKEEAAAMEAKRKEEAAAMEAKRKEEAETKRREEALAAALAEARRKEAAEAKRREEEAAEAKRREEIQAAAAAEARRKEDAKAAAEAFNRQADQQEIAKKELEEARQMRAEAEVGRKRPRDDGLSGPTTKKPSLLSTLTSAIPVLFGAIYDTLNDPDGAAAEMGNSPK
jgi:hypothetical protein